MGFFFCFKRIGNQRGLSGVDAHGGEQPAVVRQSFGEGGQCVRGNIPFRGAVRLARGKGYGKGAAGFLHADFRVLLQLEDDAESVVVGLELLEHAVKQILRGTQIHGAVIVPVIEFKKLDHKARRRTSHVRTVLRNA
ncbi:hypothetical protein SDC9_211931 [bioreactor metagenome]|uniref:Uncharacterized protein n=1 Tax=bioreactor metagenome TaxID=1076179 RepID=A0A645JM33_9ZZZZ